MSVHADVMDTLRATSRTFFIPSTYGNSCHRCKHEIAPPYGSFQEDAEDGVVRSYLLRGYHGCG